MPEFTHSDEPTLEDLLERHDMLKRVGDTIAGCRPPYVIGVHGDWGVGKTSFLHQLQWFLTGECPQCEHGKFQKDPLGENERDHLTVIWFEAWQYQHESSPIVALLHEIRTQLPLHCKALNETKKLGEVVIRTALRGIDDVMKLISVGHFSGIVKNAQETGEKWEREHHASALPSQAIRELLDHHLGQLLRGGDPILLPEEPSAKTPRVVVMIDDLDRCEPEAAFRLLEGIKIYLNLKTCVFVLGMNQTRIERVIAKPLKGAAPGEDPVLVAREYREKLCQEIWHLPNIIRPEKFLKDCLPGTEQIREQIAEQVKKHPGCLPANPRKIKAVANVMRHLLSQFPRRLPQAVNPERHAQLIIIFACLYQFHPDLYRMIEAYEIKFYNAKLLNWSRGLAVAADEHPLLKRLERTQTMPATEPKGGEATPAPTATLENTFPDPVRDNVLRVQSLILEAGELTDDDLKKYLVR